jgi:FixJ family two-component response regulator
MTTPPALASRPKAAVATKPRILLVDDEPALVDLVRDVVGRSFDCELLTASTLHEARRVMSNGSIELLMADLNLPDGDGMSLLAALRRDHPLAGAIIITGVPSVERVVGALRGGAMDFLSKPFTASQLSDHVRQALARQARAVKDGRRLDRLRDAVKRLNDARKLVSRKVDLLCNDLIGAYSDLARQLDVVRVQEGFRKTAAEARDLEQLLCNTMDWILRQLGYCNIAIWLAAGDEDFQLGAYMKYTIGGEPALVSAMKDGLLRTVNQRGVVHLPHAQVQQNLSERELDFLADQNVLGANCTYMAESLASVVVFRDANKPFTEDDVETLKAISPIFAVALAGMVRGPRKYQTDDNPFCNDNPTDADDDGDDDSHGGAAGGSAGDGSTDVDDPRRRPGGSRGRGDHDPGPGHWQSPRPRSRKNDADWWKRGEPPPF